VADDFNLFASVWQLWLVGWNVLNSGRSSVMSVYLVNYYQQSKGEPITEFLSQRMKNPDKQLYLSTAAREAGS
jgi:hypothetical protein